MNPHRAPKPKRKLLRAIGWGLVALQGVLAFRRHHRLVQSTDVATDREVIAMDPSGPSEPEVKPVKTFIWAFVGLQVLLAGTIGSAFVNLGGAANTAINLSASALMLLLLMTLFMHESKARTLTWLVSLAGVLWVILMIGLVLSDYLTRVHIPAPWS